MSFTGTRPKFKTVKYIPQSTDPVNPVEGEVYYSNGTPRAEGLWVYKNGTWEESNNGSGGDKNYITNGDASNGTTGWTTYTSVLSVTAANVDTTGETFTIIGHGLPQGRRIQVTSSGTLPSPLTINTDYYVLNPTTNTFQLSITNGGAAIDITTQGTGTHSVKPARPVTVSGSSSAVAIATTTSSPLEGPASFLISRTTPSMGEGVYKAFTIDNADKNRVLQKTFDYTFDSGTYNNVNTVLGTDSDFICMIQDVTNGTFIEPSSIMIDGVISGQNAKFNAVFQTTDSTSYRLLIHSTQDLRTAVIKADNFKISPQDYAYGNPINSEQSVGSITLGAVTTSPTKGTVVIDEIKYSRIGDRGRFIYRYQQSSGGIAGSGDYLYTLPIGLSFASSVLKNSGAITSINSINTSAYAIGTAAFTDVGGSSAWPMFIIPYDNTRFRVFASTVAPLIQPQASGFYPFTISDLEFAFDFTVPIAGWESSVQMSNETSTRVVALQATGTIPNVSADGILIFPTVTKDTHATYNASTGRYTIPVSGWYEIESSSASGTATTGRINLYADAVLVAMIGYHNSTSQMYVASGKAYFNAGQIIDLRSQVGLNSFTSTGSLSISRISGPSQIAASETVAASYLATAGSSAATNITFNTKQIDTHNAWNGTQFSVPISGIYRCSLSVFVGLGAGGSYRTAVYKNGTLFNFISGYDNAPAGGSSHGAPGSVLVEANAGDLISFRTTTTGTTTFAAGNAGNFAIERIGNKG